MKTTLQVPKNYSSQECVINFDGFKTKTANLDEFINQLIVVKTEQKWRTWGRSYIEISPNILNHFGIVSNIPLTVYLNYVYNHYTNKIDTYFYCYTGKIFSGDAAWFESYSEVQSHEISKLNVFEYLKNALENKSKSFLDYFDCHAQKWTVTPVENIEASIIAQAMNSHIK